MHLNTRSQNINKQLENLYFLSSYFAMSSLSLLNIKDKEEIKIIHRFSQVCPYELRVISTQENYPWIGTDKKIFFVL